MKSRPIGKPEFSQLKKYLIENNAWDALKLATLLYYGGLRVSEALQWSNDEIKEGATRGWLSAWISKQSIRRDIPLTIGARQELLALLEHTPGKRLFVNYKDGESARVSLNRFIGIALGKGYTSHGFRRALITDMLRDGSVPLGDVQRIVGHRNPATTIGYLHDSLEHKLAAISKVR